MKKVVGQTSCKVEEDIKLLSETLTVLGPGSSITTPYGRKVKVTSNYLARYALYNPLGVFIEGINCPKRAARYLVTGEVRWS